MKKEGTGTGTNYLHPDGTEDTVEEIILSTRIFAKALGFLLREEKEQKEGIIIEMDDKKYLVLADNDQIEINEFEDDVPDGQLIWAHTKDFPEDAIMDEEEYKEYLNKLDKQNRDNAEEDEHLK